MAYGFGILLLILGVFVFVGLNSEKDPKKKRGVGIFGVAILLFGVFLIVHHRMEVNEVKSSQNSSSAKKINKSTTENSSSSSAQKSSLKYSDVIVSTDKLDLLASQLENGDTSSFVNDFTAMTTSEQSKYYSELVKRNVSVTLSGKAYAINSDRTQLYIYANNDIPGTNLNLNSASQYFQKKQKLHNSFIVNMNTPLPDDVHTTDEIKVSGKLDSVPNIFAKDKIDGYFKLNDASLVN